jgi:hypothetical protein
LTEPAAATTRKRLRRATPLARDVGQHRIVRLSRKHNAREKSNITVCRSIPTFIHCGGTITPHPRCVVWPRSINLCRLTNPVNTALNQTTRATPRSGMSSARSYPYGCVGVAGRLEKRKPKNTTKEVETSERLCDASPSRLANPLTSAVLSAISPVRASTSAETPTGSFVAWRCAGSSRCRVGALTNVSLPARLQVCCRVTADRGPSLQRKIGLALGLGGLW